MVRSLTSAVVPLYGAVAEIACATGNPELRQVLNQMGERLSRLEGAFDWIKVTIAMISAVVIGGIAFLGVQIARVDSRVSALSEKVDALPEKVNANLRDLTNTLAQAILASKQAAPQVIVLPVPQPSAIGGPAALTPCRSGAAVASPIARIYTQSGARECGP